MPTVQVSARIDVAIEKALDDYCRRHGVVMNHFIQEALLDRLEELEDIENGIHPSRVPNLAELLRDYAVDVDDAVGTDNPLRQVVLNTHSPEVARQLSFDELVFVERALTKQDGSVSTCRPITGAWRTHQPDGTESTTQAIDQQAVVDFIGGSPVNSEFDFIGRAS